MDKQLNNFKVGNDGVNPMGYFAGSMAYITLKHKHTCKNTNMPGFIKCYTRACTGIYPGHSPFHTNLVVLILNLTTGHVSPRQHVPFNGQFSTFPFMQEGSIPTDWVELIQWRFQSSTP